MFWEVPNTPRNTGPAGANRDTDSVNEWAEEFVDPDVDLSAPDQLAELHPHEWLLLSVIAAGGILGAEGRYALGCALPRSHGEFPWATFATNVLGCLLIGVLMVVVLDVFAPAPRYLRPFLGVGVLGGFTTFSTFGVDAVRLVDEHHAATAVLYVVISVAACLLAVWITTLATTRALVRG